MARRLLTAVAALAGALAAPGIANAQPGAADGRPAMLPYGVLSPDGTAAVGAGLRLFRAPDQALVVPITPVPGAAAQPVPPAGETPSMPIRPVGAGPGTAALPPSPMPPSAKPAALPRQAVAPVPAASTTSYRADPAVSARIRQEVLSATLPGGQDPARLRDAVESGAIWEEFDRLLTRHGYDPRDLADVVAAFYLIAWEVATGGDALAQPAGIAAVRGQAREMLARNAATAGQTEAERQATAERLAFHAMAIAIRHQDLRAAGNRAALATYRTEVAQAVLREQRVDLRRFALVASGFQAR